MSLIFCPLKVLFSLWLDVWSFVAFTFLSPFVGKDANIFVYPWYEEILLVRR